MSNFRRFTFLTTIATYFLIFVGGLVRVSGAGLGCPDWPQCFGRWIPPTSISQVPPELAGQFNMTLAWIEYINRLCGMTVGLLILFTALWAIFKFRSHKKILYPAMAAAILTAFQGWQGSVLVSSLLAPIVITVHMLLALLIVSLLIYTTAQAYFLEKKEQFETQAKVPKELPRWFGWLWLLGLIQILFGTQIRSAIEMIQKEFPNLHSNEWLSQVGFLNHIHMLIGVLLLAFTWYVFAKVKPFKNQMSTLVNQSALATALVVTVQLILGLVFVFFDLRPLTQVFHLWLASIYIGLVLFVYVSLKKQI
jgi:cytochrome c oxidase assembly protein subunit 15